MAIDTSDETIHFVNDSKSYEKEGKYNIRDFKIKNMID